MAGTKLVCPHCTAVLKSGKTLPVGKQVTCVKCKERFAFATEMIASSTGDTHHDSAFSLAETQAGMLPSPIAGMTLPAQAAEAPGPTGEEPAAGANPSGGLITRPHDHGRGRSSSAAVVGAFVLIMLVLLISAGAGLVYYVYGLARESRDAQPIAEVKNPSPQEPPPALVAKAEPPQKTVPAREKPTKKVIPVVATPSPVKTDDKLVEKIDASTRRGVQFLRQAIKSNGTWKEDTDIHSTGYAALPGLAMLECGVSAKEPVLQQAAVFVRAQAPRLKETYDIGTAILFLDRLGDPSDKKLIRNLAVRLMAGQTVGGGWTYECPILTDDEQLKLLAFLNSHKPEIKLLIPLQGMILDPNPMKKDPARGDEPSKPGKKTKPKEVEKAAQDVLPPRLRKLPIVAQQIKKLGYLESSADDNSNTHFALLGLWAARRHGASVELSLGLAAERFHKTQAKDGGWGYVVRSPPKNTMTCVGLMGLAMGHGSAAELFAEAAAKNKTPVKSLARDPAIHEALKALGQYLDGEQELRGLETRIDLYYLWSLERVGMLYRQKEFGKKDWFVYGAQLILERQQNDGRWQVHYDSPIDTAFALLFLNRSDLIGDLTNSLHAYLDIPLANPIADPRDRDRWREREKARGKDRD